MWRRRKKGGSQEKLDGQLNARRLCEGTDCRSSSLGRGGYVCECMSVVCKLRDVVEIMYEKIEVVLSSQVALQKCNHRFVAVVKT